MFQKTEGLILYRLPYSDSSWVLKCLTEDFGIVSFLIKGGKRLESPFKGVLEPLMLSELVYRFNPKSELQFLKEAHLVSNFSVLKSDLEAYAIAQVMAEIILRYAPQGVPLNDEFRLLKTTLERFDKCPKTEHLFAEWILKTCELWGYFLDLERCSRCDSLLLGPAADFHPEEGGLICKKCLNENAPRAKKETLESLWNLKKNEPLLHKEFAENALLSYLKRHVGYLREIKSIQFLKETRSLYR